MIGLDDYKNRTKETWRGWQWNRIRDLASLSETGRSPIGPAAIRRSIEDKRILYLVGPEDIDRQVAISKGFSHDNLIAIDVEDEKVARVRSEGGVAVCESIESIILNWPQNMIIGAICLDLCCGITTDVMALPGTVTMSHGVVPSTVISVNLLRGRDARSIEVKECGVLDMLSMIPRKSIIPDNWKVHRGFMAAAMHWSYQMVLWERDERNKTICSSTEWAIELWRRMECHFYSYPSYVGNSVQWFDSVVFRHAGLSHGFINQEEIKGIEIECGDSWKRIAAEDQERQAKKMTGRGRGSGRTRQKLAAMRAVMTSKKRRMA